MLPKFFNKQTYEPFETSGEAPTPGDKPVATVATLVPLRSAPGTSIRYDADLVAQFKEHHAWLRDALASIRGHVEKGEFSEAQRALQWFRRTLTTHLLEENIKLYTYVSKCLANDPDTKASMLAMKAEMDPVGTNAMRFANEYAKAGVTPFTRQQFLERFDATVAALTDRMDWEEKSLYTMYMAPDAYA